MRPLTEDELRAVIADCVCTADIGFDVISEHIIDNVFPTIADGRDVDLADIRDCVARVAAEVVADLRRFLAARTSAR